MKTKTYLTIVALAAISMLSGCAKDGDPGPKGDPGKTGDPGPNATTFQYTVTSWGSVPDILTITAADGLNISSSNVAIGYMKSGSEWIPLPYINNIGGGVFTYYRNSFHADNFKISVVDSDGGATTQSSLLSVPRDIKIVIIPARLANPNVNVNNYEEVKAAYNLKD